MVSINIASIPGLPSYTLSCTYIHVRTFMWGEMKALYISIIILSIIIYNNYYANRGSRTLSEFSDDSVLVKPAYFLFHGIRHLLFSHLNKLLQTTHTTHTHTHTHTPYTPHSTLRIPTQNTQQVLKATKQCFPFPGSGIYRFVKHRKVRP